MPLSDSPPLLADDLGGPVAPAAHGVEGEVGRAVVDPTGNAVPRGPPRAHDELPARVRVREHALVVAHRLPVRKDLHLNEGKHRVKR